jgi:ABC-type multidrug transport system ATPase subunit
MLCTITKSTSVAEVSGSDAKVDLGTVLRQIGIVLQKPSLEDGLKGENMAPCEFKIYTIQYTYI